jgi:hypothetical protein
MKLLLFKSNQNDPLSAAIKAITRSQYCHAAILIDSLKWFKVFQALIPEPDPPGCRYILAEEFYPEARTRWIQPSECPEIDVFSIRGWDDTSEDLAMRFILQTIRDEVKYDIEDLFRFLAPLRAILGESSDEGSKRRMFCSYFYSETRKSANRPMLNCHSFEIAPDQCAWPIDTIPDAPLS